MKSALTASTVLALLAGTAMAAPVTYKGTLASFKDGAPTEVKGELTLHGVTKPVTLKINKFTCKPNPMTKKEVCGADASTTINRGDFGIKYGDNFGFNLDTKLAIQIEAVRQD